MGNSVIYRPAYDAEVEFLESTGTQYIDTGIKPDNTYTFDCKVAKIQSNYNCIFWGTRNSGDSTTFNEQCYLNANDSGSVTQFAKIILFSTSTNTPESNWNSGITPIVNTMYELTGMTVVSTMNQMTYPITLFGFNMIGVINTSLGICRIGYWKCYSNGVLVRDMIPVRIGSVGYMYDKVSKQLFANKGTGNFILGNDVVNAVIPQQRCVLYFGNQRSVGFERIYEEYEWIIGDQTAYIDVPMNLWQNGVDINIGKVDSQEDYFTIIANRGRLVIETQPNNDVLMVVFRDDVGNPLHIADIAPYSSIPSEVNMQFYIDNGVAYCIQNGITHRGEEMSENQWNYNINSLSYLAKVSYLREYNKSDNSYIKNLVPCKLLQSIPAALDGNGIARQAGECGMWDKVSNRFYGNVASSGTFTVKGPKCYEEYKWLNCYTADGATLPAQGADIGITPISLTNKVLTIELGQVSRNVAIYSTSQYFMPMWCMYVNNMYVMQVQERKGNDNTIHNVTYNWATSNTITLDFINNVATLGNSTFQIEGTGYTFSGFNSTMWQNPRTVGRIKISDELDLVPCKLTHGIPASMDANGISRPAGTCGMWDKVNDKFYGNVANSGTFTVSND